MSSYKSLFKPIFFIRMALIFKLIIKMRLCVCACVRVCVCGCGCARMRVCLFIRLPACHRHRSDLNLQKKKKLSRYEDKNLLMFNQKVFQSLQNQRLCRWKNLTLQKKETYFENLLNKKFTFFQSLINRHSVTF